MAELTAEMIADLAILSDVQIAPDAQRVAYVLMPASKRGEHFESSIWVASVEGADQEPRQFTSGEAMDNTPRWSPDGRYLAFLSDRKERGNAQLHLMRAGEGEARALTEGKSPIGAGFILSESFAWSPDGSRIAFTSPDPPTEEQTRRQQERDDANVYGEHWPYFRLRIVDLADGSPRGEPRTIVAGNRHVGAFCWTPDGTRLICVIRKTPDLEQGYVGPGQIVEVALDGSGERVIREIEGWAGGLVCSTDGRWVLFTRPVDGMVQSEFAVWRLALDTGHLERIASGESNCIWQVQQPTGADRPVCHLMEGLDTRLVWLDPATGDLETLYDAGDAEVPLGSWSVAVVNGAPVLAVVRTDGQTAGEVWAGAPHALSSRSAHHPELSGVELGTQSDFRWTAADGLELDGLLILPPGAPDGLRHPAVVLVHGGPYERFGRGLHLLWADWAQWLATAGFAVLLPNPRGGCAHGNAFAMACVGDVGGADWGDVLSMIDAAVERGIVDQDRLGIGGWSQGGYVAAWAVTQTDRFGAAVMGAGICDWGMEILTSDIPATEALYGGGKPWDGVGPHPYAGRSPIAFVDRVTTPLLILHGENDRRIPAGQARGFHRALLERGAAVELVIYPREGHPILERAHQIDVLRRVREWYTRHLQLPAPSEATTAVAEVR